ncbi:hypothetical protein D1007_46740 [Hordeum vulgare]|nr:hypothetical protein D1007_46740 [Hordeum vulgare]
MVDDRRDRTERRATLVAQTAPAGPAGVRQSPSPVVNAATGPDAQEQQGSSEPATEQDDGHTATQSLIRASGSASRARPEMPHGGARFPWPLKWSVTGLPLTATTTSSSALRSSSPLPVTPLRSLARIDPNRPC